MSQRIPKKFSLFSFILGAIFASVLVGAASIISFQNFKHSAMLAKGKAMILAKPAQAVEIFPEFLCSCCGKALDPKNICCGDMRQKIDYIETLADAELSREKIIMKAAKKFGLKSLTKEDTKAMVKDKLLSQAPANAARLNLSQASYDFGTISQADGVVFSYFTFKNEGKSNLIINKLTTSCGCTSAAVVYQGQEGPSFTMPGHGKKNPQNWSVAIAPGDSAQIKVYYDPNAHGKQEKDSLSITRAVSVFSNDPIDFEKQVRIELEQTP